MIKQYCKIFLQLQNKLILLKPLQMQGFLYFIKNNLKINRNKCLFIQKHLYLWSNKLKHRNYGKSFKNTKKL